jgi:hypothetical protein
MSGIAEPVKQTLNLVLPVLALAVPILLTAAAAVATLRGQKAEVPDETPAADER